MSPNIARSAALTEGPIASTLLLFSLPILGANVLQSLNASVNAVWIGHFLGEAALTAVSNANLVLFFLLGVVFGISMANTILVGQAMGTNDIGQAKRVVGTSTGFSVVLSATVAILGYVFTAEILGAMGTPADAQPYAISYLHVIFIALPSMYFYSFLMMTLRGTGDSQLISLGNARLRNAIRDRAGHHNHHPRRATPARRGLPLTARAARIPGHASA